MKKKNLTSNEEITKLQEEKTEIEKKHQEEIMKLQEEKSELENKYNVTIINKDKGFYIVSLTKHL